MLAACHWGVKNPLNIYKVEIMDRIAPSPYNIQWQPPLPKIEMGFLHGILMRCYLNFPDDREWGDEASGHIWTNCIIHQPEIGFLFWIIVPTNHCSSEVVLIYPDL
jgi:hypothetical protein